MPPIDAVDGSSTGTQVPKKWVLLRLPRFEELHMQTITTIGLDIAKSVFQVHGVDAAGQVVIRRQLKRRYVLAFFQKLSPCLVGIEACASSHRSAGLVERLVIFDVADRSISTPSGRKNRLASSHKRPPRLATLL
jgi:hypothetical protein